MPSVRHPSLALPGPLRAAEPGTFTHHSVVNRLPDIARRTLAENKFPPEVRGGIQSLIDEIPTGKIRPLRLPTPVEGLRLSPCEARSLAGWAEWTKPYEGMDWLEAPWFFIEEYFYMRILEASGYFFPGPGRGLDPFLQQKRLGLASTRGAIGTLAARLEETTALAGDDFGEAFAGVLLADLWGNQNDLSMWPVQHGHQEEAAITEARGNHAAAGREKVISDDLDAVVETAARAVRQGAPLARVDILLDNAGYELVADLALADFLLSAGGARQVRLHAKCQPVFVSDAMEKDIHETLDFLCRARGSAARAFGVRLRRALVGGALAIRQHAFWTSPLPAWEMPPDLQEEMDGCALLIVKGDANYRRLLGDHHWPTGLPFAQAVDYFPFDVLALRTLKSEIATGILPGRVPDAEPDWMYNGRWGVIQYARGRS